jgi:predicted ester cyclase
MDDLVETQGKILYHWTFEGTHSETGKRVRISGFEAWRIGDDGLIAESLGNFDTADLERQIKGANS